MTEQERILQMVDSGKLSQREAAEILAALSDLEAADTQLGEAQEEIRAEVTEETPTETSRGPQAERVKSAAKSDNASAEPCKENLPEGFSWLKINMLAGDIDVRTDNSLTEPVIDKGNAQLVQEGKDYIVRGTAKQAREKHKEGLDGFLEGVNDWVAALTSRVGDLSVRVPEGYAVFIESKAGDVDVVGVAYLKANLMAGDIDIRDVGGLDISASAGDIDVDFKPTSGMHRIQATAGDVDVKLQKGSAVTFTGSVNMGEIDLERHDGGTIERRGGHIGGSASTVVGAGTASFDISLSAGDLDVTVYG